MKSTLTAILLAHIPLVVACSGGAPVEATPRSVAGALEVYSVEAGGMVASASVVRSEAEWQSLLTPEQYRVLRDKGTEQAFTAIDQPGHVKTLACNELHAGKQPVLYLNVDAGAGFKCLPLSGGLKVTVSTVKDRLCHPCFFCNRRQAQ